MSLYDLRTELVGLLAGAGIKSYPEAPQSFTPPGAVVEQASPYITPGDEFGTLAVHYTVTLLVNSSPRALSDLDALIAKAVPVLAHWGNGISTIDIQAFVIMTNNSTYLGAAIAVSGDISTKEIQS